MYALLVHYDHIAPGAFAIELIFTVQNSLTGPLQDLVNRERATMVAECSALELKLRSMEEKVALAQNQADAAQKDAQEWKKRYEQSIHDYQRSSESAAAQYSTLQRKVTTLEERHATTMTKLEETKREASEWQFKFDHLVTDHKKEEERISSEMKALQVLFFSIGPT